LVGDGQLFLALVTERDLAEGDLGSREGLDQALGAALYIVATRQHQTNQRQERSQSREPKQERTRGSLGGDFRHFLYSLLGWPQSNRRIQTCEGADCVCFPRDIPANLGSSRRNAMLWTLTLGGGCVNLSASPRKHWSCRWCVGRFGGSASHQVLIRHEEHEELSLLRTTILADSKPRKRGALIVGAQSTASRPQLPSPKRPTASPLQVNRVAAKNSRRISLARLTLESSCLCSATQGRENSDGPPAPREWEQDRAYLRVQMQ